MSSGNETAKTGAPQIWAFYRERCQMERGKNENEKDFPNVSEFRKEKFIQKITR